MVELPFKSPQFLFKSYGEVVSSGPSRASSGPGAINSTGPCVGVAAQGQEVATANANQILFYLFYENFIIHSYLIHLFIHSFIIDLRFVNM